MSFKAQGPHDILDYYFDWGREFLEDGEVVVDSKMIAPPGITIQHSEMEDDYTVIWISGGEISQKYDISNEIRTSGGRFKEWKFRLHIVEQR